MTSLAESNFFTNLYTPRISQRNREKFRKWKKLATPDGFSVAHGFLLKTMKNNFVSLEEIRNKYSVFLRKFSSRYYITPEFGPFCSIEKKLSIFLEYKIVDSKKDAGIIKFKISGKGQVLLESYLLDEELMNLK
jgi:hypothetical protein